MARPSNPPAFAHPSLRLPSRIPLRSRVPSFFAEDPVVVRRQLLVAFLGLFLLSLAFEYGGLASALTEMITGVPRAEVDAVLPLSFAFATVGFAALALVESLLERACGKLAATVIFVFGMAAGLGGYVFLLQTALAPSLPDVGLSSALGRMMGFAVLPALSASLPARR